MPTHPSGATQEHHQTLPEPNTPEMVALVRWRDKGQTGDADEAARLISSRTTPGSWKRGSSYYKEMVALILSAPHPNIIGAFQAHSWSWTEADVRSINLTSTESAASFHTLVRHITERQNAKTPDTENHFAISSWTDRTMNLLDRVMAIPMNDRAMAIRTWDTFLSDFLSEKDRTQTFGIIAEAGDSMKDQLPSRRRQTYWLAQNLEIAVRAGDEELGLSSMVKIIKWVAPTPQLVAQLVAVAWETENNGFRSPMTKERWSSWQRAGEAHQEIQQGLAAIDEALAESLPQIEQGISNMIRDIDQKKYPDLIRKIDNKSNSSRIYMATLGWPKDTLERWLNLYSVDQIKILVRKNEKVKWWGDLTKIIAKIGSISSWGVIHLGLVDPEEIDNARIHLLNYEWNNRYRVASARAAAAKNTWEYLCAKGEPVIAHLVREKPEFWTTLWRDRPEFLVSCVAQMPRRHLLSLLAVDELKNWSDDQGNTIAHIVMMEHGKKISVYLAAALKKNQAKNLIESNNVGYTPLDIASLMGLSLEDRAKLDLFLLSDEENGQGTRKKKRNARIYDPRIHHGDGCDPRITCKDRLIPRRSEALTLASWCARWNFISKKACYEHHDVGDYLGNGSLDCVPGGIHLGRPTLPWGHRSVHATGDCFVGCCGQLCH